MADTASWLLPSSALSVFQPSRRGSLGQGQHYLFGQSRCKRCLVQKQKPQHLGFHLYLSEMIHIDEHMGGSRHWILDCLQRTICTWTSSTSMSLCRWFALGNVRSWILQVYISCRSFPRFFTPLNALRFLSIRLSQKAQRASRSGGISTEKLPDDMARCDSRYFRGLDVRWPAVSEGRGWRTWWM